MIAFPGLARCHSVWPGIGATVCPGRAAAKSWLKSDEKSALSAKASRHINRSRAARRNTGDSLVCALADRNRRLEKHLNRARQDRDIGRQCCLGAVAPAAEGSSCSRIIEQQRRVRRINPVRQRDRRAGGRGRDCLRAAKVRGKVAERIGRPLP